jgi:hypothetical protein
MSADGDDSRGNGFPWRQLRQQQYWGPGSAGCWRQLYDGRQECIHVWQRQQQQQRIRGVSTAQYQWVMLVQLLQHERQL